MDDDHRTDDHRDNNNERVVIDREHTETERSSTGPILAVLAIVLLLLLAFLAFQALGNNDEVDVTPDATESLDVNIDNPTTAE